MCILFKLPNKKRIGILSISEISIFDIHVYLSKCFLQAVNKIVTEIHSNKNAGNCLTIS